MLVVNGLQLVFLSQSLLTKLSPSFRSLLSQTLSLMRGGLMMLLLLEAQLGFALIWETSRKGFHVPSPVFLILKKNCKQPFYITIMHENSCI